MYRQALHKHSQGSYTSLATFFILLSNSGFSFLGQRAAFWASALRSIAVIIKKPTRGLVGYDLSIFRGKPGLSRGTSPFLWGYPTLLGPLLLILWTTHILSLIPFVINLLGSKSHSSCGVTLTETVSGHWRRSPGLAVQVEEHGFWCPKSLAQVLAVLLVSVWPAVSLFPHLSDGHNDLTHLLELLWRLFENFMGNA